VTDAEVEAAYRELAGNYTATHDDHSIDTDAAVSLADRGAWVQIWLWFDEEDLPE